MRCVAYGKQTDAGMDLEVPCAATDADGDRFDTLAVRTAGGVEAGGGGRGAMVLTGATGKYAGISGTCEYDVVPCVSARLPGSCANAVPRETPISRAIWVGDRLIVKRCLIASMSILGGRPR